MKVVAILFCIFAPLVIATMIWAAVAQSLIAIILLVITAAIEFICLVIMTIFVIID